MNRSNKGFTIIELLMVIALLTILAWAVLNALMVRGDPPSHIISCMNNVRQIGQAAHMYAIDNSGGPYPNTAAPDGIPSPPVQALALLFEKRYINDYRAYQCPLDKTAKAMTLADEEALKAFARGDSSRMSAMQASQHISYSIEHRAANDWLSSVALVSDNPGQQGGAGPHRFNSTNHGIERGEGVSQNVFFIDGSTHTLKQVSTDHEKNIFADDPDLPPGKDSIIRPLTDAAPVIDTGTDE